MIILVFSDSHGDVDTMRAVLRREKPDAVIHLGDCVSDGMSLQGIVPDIPVRVVRGNNDFWNRCPDEDIVTFCEKKLFLTHGHIYRVKSGLSDLTQKGLSLEADAVLFGHTHKPYIGKSGKMWLLNPGTPRLGYGILRIEEGTLRCEIKK